MKKGAVNKEAVAVEIMQIRGDGGSNLNSGCADGEEETVLIYLRSYLEDRIDRIQ